MDWKNLLDQDQLGMPDDETGVREGQLPIDHRQRRHLLLRFRFLEPFGMA